MATDLNKFLVDIVPFRIGSRVKIAESYQYSQAWPGEYVVVGLVWEYRCGPLVNIHIASDDEIASGSGSTDGFRVEDLVPAT